MGGLMHPESLKVLIRKNKEETHRIKKGGVVSHIKDAFTNEDESEQQQVQQKVESISEPKSESEPLPPQVREYYYTHDGDKYIRVEKYYENRIEDEKRFIKAEEQLGTALKLIQGLQSQSEGTADKINDFVVLLFQTCGTAIVTGLIGLITTLIVTKRKKKKNGSDG